MANDFVKLSVGGILYTTSKATLTRYPDSMLGAMFTGSVPSTQDDGGCFLIDRDGQIFRHILNFLRCGKLVLPNSFDEHDLLKSEADFYQITPLVTAIQGYFRESKKEKDGFSFYIIEVFGRVISGTIESLLQLPPPFLSDATRENLKKLRVPHSTVSALRTSRLFPFGINFQTKLTAEGSTYEGEQTTDIISTHDVLTERKLSPDIYLKRRS